MKNLKYAGLLILSLISTQINATIIHAIPLWSDSEFEISESLNFYSGDLSVNVSGWTTSYDSDNQQNQNWQRVSAPFGVIFDDEGLGVISNEEDGWDLDGGSSGNYPRDPDEGLLFVFSEKVRLLDIFAGDVGSSDDFNFSLVEFISPESLNTTKTDYDMGRTDSSRYTEIYPEHHFVGNAFMVWMDGSSDDATVLGIAVETISEPHPLALLAIGLLFLVRRKI